PSDSTGSLLANTDRSEHAVNLDHRRALKLFEPRRNVGNTVQTACFCRRGIDISGALSGRSTKSVGPDPGHRSAQPWAVLLRPVGPRRWGTHRAHNLGAS